MIRSVLLTGATGFIGKVVSQSLKNFGFNLRVVVRQKDIKFIFDYEVAEIGDIGFGTDWTQALAGVDVVVHLAARVHMMRDEAEDLLAEYRRVNVEGTRQLAVSAAKAGVKRFIFISSVKVNGEGAMCPYTEGDFPAPEDAYGTSKKEAEDVLRNISKETGLEVVILRPSLVYGAGVKANFKNLIKISNMGLPLPFKGIDNRRSFLYLGNLIDAIVVCVEHPKAAGETFLISDGEDVSILDLMKIIADASAKRLRLFSLPYGFLRILCKIAGREKELEKLTGTLVVDSSKICNLLGWKPPFTLEEGIKETVKKGISM